LYKKYWLQTNKQKYMLYIITQQQTPTLFDDLETKILHNLKTFCELTILRKVHCDFYYRYNKRKNTYEEH